MPSRTTAASCILIASVTLVAGSGCGGTPGEKVRPKDMTMNDARGGGAATCHEIDAESTPLIVDWNPEERGDLEAAMKTGVAVMHYDCKTAKLLPDCKVEGTYGFLGITKKEQVISLDNADQAQANLPLHGASISAGMERGASIDIGLIMIGKKSTPANNLKKSMLGDHCEGATHYVQAATVGAFAMHTTANGSVHAKAAIDVFGASGESKSSKDVVNKDGEVDSCKGADVDAEKAPNGCGAPVRIRLLAITQDGTSYDAAKKDVDCPKGLVVVAGKCQEKPASVAAAPKGYECTEEEGPTVCDQQCTLGSADSCWQMVDFYDNGKGGVAKDHEKANGYGVKACDLGMWGSCDWISGNMSDYPKARAIELRACDAGSAFSCSLLASLLGKGSDKDYVKAVRAEMRACEGGEPIGCLGAADLYAKGGSGLTADPDKALKMYSALCDDKSVSPVWAKDACFNGANMILKKDPAKAKKYMTRACASAKESYVENPEQCAALKKMK